MQNYDATIEDSYRKVILFAIFSIKITRFYIFQQADVDGQACRLEILDTAGTVSQKSFDLPSFLYNLKNGFKFFNFQEQFSGMRDLYVRNGQGFVLVYAVNESRSLRDLEVLRDLIIRIKATKDVILF